MANAGYNDILSVSFTAYMEAVARLGMLLSRKKIKIAYICCLLGLLLRVTLQVVFPWARLTSLEPLFCYEDLASWRYDNWDDSATRSS